MNKSFQLYTKEAILLVRELFNFKYYENSQGIPELKGFLPLVSVLGELIDSYQIRIVCSSEYPLRFPLVYEVGGRIPINIDWHVHGDGHACICSIPEEVILCSNGINLKDFIEDQVKPYFYNQKYREMNGFFLKERSHGLKGNIEFFQEVFKTKNLYHIAKTLHYIKSNPEPNRVQNCFCGSGNKYRSCHREVFRMFKKLPNQNLNFFIKILLF